MKLTIFIILKCVIQWHSVVGPPSLFAEHCIPTRRKCCIPIKWSFPIPSPSRSWQLLLCFLFLSICLFWIFYITGITWVCVCVRLACISTSFLLRAEQYSVAWICLPFMHCRALGLLPPDGMILGKRIPWCSYPPHPSYSSSSHLGPHSKSLLRPQGLCLTGRAPHLSTALASAVSPAHTQGSVPSCLLSCHTHPQTWVCSALALILICWQVPRLLPPGKIPPASPAFCFICRAFIAAPYLFVHV